MEKRYSIIFILIRKKRQTPQRKIRDYFSLYGRLNVASTDTEMLKNANLPPTYYCYGTNEVFRSQIENQIELLKNIGVELRINMLDGHSHGFGANANWFNDYDNWLSGIFENN